MNEGIFNLKVNSGRDTSVSDLMLACEGIARLVEGIPRFPCGSAGGMGF